MDIVFHYARDHIEHESSGGGMQVREWWCGCGTSLSTDGGLDLSCGRVTSNAYCNDPLRHDRLVTMSKPTANWEKVGDKFYRKIQLYTAVFDQDLELENYNVVGAPYSGAVGRYATMRRGKHGRLVLTDDSNLPR